MQVSITAHVGYLNYPKSDKSDTLRAGVSDLSVFIVGSVGNFYNFHTPTRAGVLDLFGLALRIFQIYGETLPEQALNYYPCLA